MTHPFPSGAGNRVARSAGHGLTLAVAASFALIALIFAFRQVPAGASAYETAIGENRSVALADGSIVSLGGDTRIEVALSDKRTRHRS